MRPALATVEIHSSTLGVATAGVYRLTNTVKIFGEKFTGRVTVEAEGSGLKRWITLEDGIYLFEATQTRTDVSTAWAAPVDTEADAIASEWACLTPQAGEYLYWSNVVAPRRYELCENVSLKKLGKYARLYAVIGDTAGTTLDDGTAIATTDFRLPSTNKGQLLSGRVGGALNVKSQIAEVSPNDLVLNHALTLEQLPSIRPPLLTLKLRVFAKNDIITAIQDQYQNKLSSTISNFNPTPRTRAVVAVGGGGAHDHPVTLKDVHVNPLIRKISVRICISF